jgi:hypothetical protein
MLFGRQHETVPQRQIECRKICASMGEAWFFSGAECLMNSTDSVYPGSQIQRFGPR